jgi:hypothetical protein
MFALEPCVQLLIEASSSRDLDTVRDSNLYPSSKSMNG